MRGMLRPRESVHFSLLVVAEKGAGRTRIAGWPVRWGATVRNHEGRTIGHGESAQGARPSPPRRASRRWSRRWRTIPIPVDGSVNCVPGVVDDDTQKHGDSQVGEEDVVTRHDILEERQRPQPRSGRGDEEHGEEGQQTEEPQDTLASPHHAAPEADHQNAEAEILSGEHRALVATDDPEEGRAEGAVDRRLRRKEESLCAASEGVQTEAGVDRS
jgi:hypothetical protein